jgi:peptide/nickel transport system ATP-binding protein
MALKRLLKKKQIKGVDDVASLSLKEERRISHENAKVMRTFERRMNRRNVSQEEYAATMKNPEKSWEFDNLHTFSIRISARSRRSTVSASTSALHDRRRRGRIRLRKVRDQPVADAAGAGAAGTDCGRADRFFLQRRQVYDIAKMPRSEMLKIRGREISMIFQEPMTSLNPVFTVGEQLDEVVLLHEHATPEQANSVLSRCSSWLASPWRRRSTRTIRTSFPAACASAS